MDKNVAIIFSLKDRLSLGVSQIDSRMRALASTNETVAKSFASFKTAAKVFAIAGSSTYAIGKGLKPAINLAADLQEEMIGLKAETMGVGVSAAKVSYEMSKYMSTAFSIQAATPYDMTQIVALEKALKKSGASVAAITGKAGAASAASMVAAYEKIDPVLAGELLIGIGTPFKISADKYMWLADQISRASSASTASVMDIAMGGKFASEAMAPLGFTITEMVAMSGLLRNKGMTGEQTGTALRAFFKKAAGYRDKKTNRLEFVDKKGILNDIKTISEKLQKMFKGKGSAIIDTKLTDMFGMESASVGTALMEKGEYSLASILEKMKFSLSLEEKMTERMKGFNAQMQSLKGTSSSVIANLFIPALDPIALVIAQVNKLMTAIGNASLNNKSIGEYVSAVGLTAFGTSAGVTVGAGGLALAYGIKALKAAGVYKGLIGNMGGTGAGILKGKLIQEIAGITPVFVTNWPAGGIGVDGGSGINAGTIATGAATGAALGWKGGLMATGKTAITKALPVAATLGAGDIVLGSIHAGKIAQKHNTDLNPIERILAARSNVLSGLTGGLISPQTMYDLHRYFTPSGLLFAQHDLFNNENRAKTNEYIRSQTNVKGSNTPTTLVENIINLVIHQEKDGNMSTRSDNKNTKINVKTGKLGG